MNIPNALCNLRDSCGISSIVIQYGNSEPTEIHKLSTEGLVIKSNAPDRLFMAALVRLIRA